jgi:hypothetical protein
MDLGQALAMMRYANQLQDYSNRYNARPNLDWADIASQPAEDYQPYGPQPSAMQSAPEPYARAMGDIFKDAIAGMPQPAEDVVAGYAPQTPVEKRGMPAFMVDPAFQELYGAAEQMPPTLMTPMAFAPTSSTYTGVAGALPSFTPPPMRTSGFAGRPTMPTLPIPGGMSADVYPIEPMQPERSIAMAAPAEQQPEEVQLKPEQPKVEQPKWEVGQPFPVTIDMGGGKIVTGTVKDFTAPAEGMRPRPVRVTLPNNREIDIPPTNATVYNQIVDQYKNLVSSTTPVKDETYTSLVKLQNQQGEDVWAKARVDPNEKKIFYIDPEYPEMGELQYGRSIADIIPNENYKGPTDEFGTQDLTQLDELRGKTQRFLEPTIQRVAQTATGYVANMTPTEITSSLIPRFVPGEEGDVLGNIEWSIIDPETKAPLSLEDAAAKGIIPSDLVWKLNDSYERLKKYIDERAASELAMQAGQAMTFRESTKKIINDEIEEIKALMQTAPSQDMPTLNAKLKAKKNELTNLLGSKATYTAGGGGDKVYEGAPEVTTYSLDPTNLGDRLALVFGASSQPSPYSLKTTQVPTMRDIANFAIEDAMKDIRSNAVDVSPLFNQATSVLVNRLREIEQAAVDRYGEYADDVLNQPATFIWLEQNPMDVATEAPITGAEIPEQRSQHSKISMPLKDAIEQYQRYLDAYRRALVENPESASQAKENVDMAGKLFSGAIVLPGMAGQPPLVFRATPESSILGYVGDLFTPRVEIDTSIPGRMAVTPAIKQSAPPKATIEEPPTPRSVSGTGTKADIAFPLLKPKYGKTRVYSTGENLLDDFDDTEAAYVQNGKAYSAKEVAQTTADNLKRALMFDRGGNLENKEKQALTESINNLNRAISSDAGAPERAALVQTLWNATDALGFKIGDKGSGVAAELERIRTKAKSGADVSADLKNFIYNVIQGKNPQETYKAFINSNPGAQVTRINQQPNSDQFKSKFDIQGPTSRMYENILQAWYEMALMYAASGAKDSTGNNAVAYTPDPNKWVRITWIADPTVSGGNVHSVITIPTAKETGPTASVPFANLKDKGFKDISTDPAADAAVTAANSILSTHIQPVESRWKQPGVSTPLKNTAKDNFREVTKQDPTNLYGINQTDRPKSNEKTQWGPASEDAIADYSIKTILLGNVFMENRNRRVYLPGKPWGNGWPGFDRSRIVTP